MLSFVEAESLEAPDRTLHVWQLAIEGDIQSAPIRCEFPFSIQGRAGVSVPKPVLSRFVLLKTCSVMEGDDPLLNVQVFDVSQKMLLYQVSTRALDSTLFRRSHPLADLILGFWVAMVGGGKSACLKLYNLAKSCKVQE